MLKIIDADIHLTEPHDLWPTLAPTKWKQCVPQVEVLDGQMSGVIDGHKSIGTGAHPNSAIPRNSTKARDLDDLLNLRFDHARAGSASESERLAVMDQAGIYAQLVYPNVLEFGGQASAKFDPRLRLVYVQVCSDAMADIWGIEVESTLVPIKPPTVGLRFSYLNVKLLTALAALPPGGIYNQISFSDSVGFPFFLRTKVSRSAAYRLPIPRKYGAVSVGTTFTCTSGQLVSEAAYPYQGFGPYGLMDVTIRWDDMLGSNGNGEVFGTNLANRFHYDNTTQLYESPSALQGAIWELQEYLGLEIADGSDNRSAGSAMAARAIAQALQ